MRGLKLAEPRYIKSLSIIEEGEAKRIEGNSIHKLALAREFSFSAIR